MFWIVPLCLLAKVLAQTSSPTLQPTLHPAGTTPYIMFMTPSLYTGNIPNPDSICQSLATSYGLTQGTAFAFLSPCDRCVFMNTVTTRALVSLTGGIIKSPVAGFADGISQSMDDSGVCIPGSGRFWGGFSAGLSTDVSANCLGWTNDDPFSEIGSTGNCQFFSSSGWITQPPNRFCSSSFRFLCVYDGLTGSPTISPTTTKPSKSPSRSPSKSPSTALPSKSPSKSPSRSPTTNQPSKSPSTATPSKNPVTTVPSKSPTKSPTFTSRLILYSDNELTTGNLGTYADAYNRCNETQLKLNLECSRVEPFLYFGEEYESKLPGNLTTLPIYDVYGSAVASNWASLIGTSTWSNSLRDILEYKSWSYGSVNCNNWQSESDCLNGLIQNPKSTKFSNKRAGCNTAKTILCLCQGNKELNYRTFRPTTSPTTSKPTKSPITLGPTKSPSASSPSKGPSASSPSNSPSKTPTIAPTLAPTLKPTLTPTLKPTLTPTAIPTASPTELLPTQISTSEGQACARMNSGSIKCWGNVGALAAVITNLGSSLTPVAVSGVSDAVKVCTGFNYRCYLAVGGQVLCWGLYSNGALGTGIVSHQPVPTLTVGITTATDITCGDLHACALLSSGEIKCWGHNDDGEIGDGTRTLRNSPTTVSGITTATEVRAGGQIGHTCALLSSQQVKCWGEGSLGQLGDGTSTDRLTPATVSGITTAISVRAGHLFSCALLASQSVQCWGYNGAGSLGDGTIIQKSSPVFVLGITTAVEICTGDAHACARLASGSVLCWGYNFGGELGDGTTTQRNSPVSVLGVTAAVEVSCGKSQTCVRLSNGQVQCFGLNSNGQTGDGTTTSPRLTIVNVLF